MLIAFILINCVFVVVIFLGKKSALMKKIYTDTPCKIIILKAMWRTHLFVQTKCLLPPEPIKKNP